MIALYIGIVFCAEKIKEKENRHSNNHYFCINSKYYGSNFQNK